MSLISRLSRKLGARGHVVGMSAGRSAQARSREAVAPDPTITNLLLRKRRGARLTVSFIAVAVACGSYLLGASVTQSASGDVGNKVGVSFAQGIDSCHLPPIPVLRYMYNKFPEQTPGWELAYIGFYVGGRVPQSVGCKKKTKAGNSILHAIGYDFLPTMDGRQPPCSIESTSPTVHFSEDPTSGFRKAREEAAEEADIAVKRLNEGGFTTPGSIVYYDFESFDIKDPDHPHCLAAAQAFINNWDRRLELFYEVKAGLYGPAGGANVDEFWNLENRPADLWYSETQGEGAFKLNKEHDSVWSVPKGRIPDSHWPERRLHQWEKEIHLKTPNGIYKLDLTCARGLVAGTGGQRGKSECFAGEPE